MKTCRSVVFKLWSGNHRGSVMLIAGFHRLYKGVLKFYIIRLAIDQRICISSYLYIPMKIPFKQQPPLKFWFQSIHYYLKKRSKMLLPITVTYLFETAFSALTNMMTKYRSRFVVLSELRVSLSRISPKIVNLCQGRQLHPSH